MPVDEVVAASGRGQFAAVAGGFVLQELDPGARGSAEAGDSHRRTWHTRELLLLDPDVPALAGDAQAEQVAIEGEARRRATDANRGVVNAEEEPIARLLPARIAPAGWKMDQLQCV